MKMTVDTITPSVAPLVLAKRLDLTEVTALRQSLLDHLDQAITLDASGVVHLGGLCLQVLLSAALDQRAAGRALHISPRSTAFDSALSSFAVSLGSIQSEISQ